MPARLLFVFPRRYQAELVPERAAPQAVRLGAAEPPPLHIPELPPGEKPQPGLLVRVTPEGGAPWTARFANGYESPVPYSGLVSTPDPQRLCVVAAGYAYLVEARDASRWEKIACDPVLEVLVIEDLPGGGGGLLVFVNFTTLVAYGAQGLAWQTERLSWEGVRVVEVTPQRILGYGWDAGRDAEVEFTVDPATGVHQGGTRPGPPQQQPAKPVR